MKYKHHAVSQHRSVRTRGWWVPVHMCVHVAACVCARAWVYGMCIAIVHASVRKGV